MQAILFNFSKRLNSTKRPVDGEGTVVTVSIKQNVPKGQSSAQSGTETFLSHPTLWLQGDYTSYNYMKFKGMYYFIRDIQLTINDATVIYGEIDVLASFKEDILNTTAKVVYSSNDYNIHLDDARMNMTNEVEVVTNKARMFELPYSDNGTYIVTAVGLNAALHANTWILTPEEYKILVDFCNGISSEQTLAQEAMELVQTFTCCAQAIASVKWTPLILAGDNSSPVTLGHVAVTDPITSHNPFVASYNLSRLGSEGLTRDIQIPKLSGINDYRNGSRFRTLYLSIPFCGIYPVDADSLYGIDTVHLRFSMDWVTGDILGSVSYKLEDDTIATLLTFSGCAYSDVPFGQSVNPAVQGVVETLVGAATFAVSEASAESENLHGLSNAGKSRYFLNTGSGDSNTVSTNVSFNGNSVISGIKSASQKAGCTGANNSSALGCVVTRNEYIEFTCVQHLTPELPTAIRSVLGLPCNKTRKLEGLTGYCQTKGISVDTATIGSIKSAINAAVDNGIFIE